MQRFERDQIKQILNDINKIDISEIMLNHYQDLKKEIYLEISPEDFIIDSKIMINRLELLIKDKRIYKYIAPTNISNKNILADLEDFKYYLNLFVENKDYFINLTEAFLKIYNALISINLWDRINIKPEVDLFKERQKIALTVKSINKASKLILEQQQTIDEQHEISKKIKEEYDKRLQEVLEENKELKEILNSSREQLNNLSKIEGQIEEKQQKINEISKYVNLAFAKVEEEKTIVLKTKQTMDEQYTFMAEELNQFREQNKELRALYEEKEFFEKYRAFNSRKKELIKSVNLWSIFSLLGIGGFGFIVFKMPTIDYSLNKTLIENIVPLGYNSIKLIPLGVLLGFILKQYSNERKHLEIYAFKAAQVLVLDNHAEKMKENKDDFLKTTLDKIHNEPFQTKKSKKILSKKDFKEVLSFVENGMKLVGKKGLTAKLEFEDKEK